MRLDTNLLKFSTIALFIRQSFFSLVNFFVVRKNYVEIYVIQFNFQNLLKALKYNTACNLKTLSDLIVTDFIKNEVRFKLSYNFLSFWGLRVFLHTFLKELELGVSMRALYPSAGWLEREAWDLYGVWFLNHNDLRRILTDYGFRGFPFRKDFPLTGYIEIRYDDTKGDIVYEPVELAQEMRFFNFATGWEAD